MASPAVESFPYRTKLDRPVIGMESEFSVYVDGREIIPEEYWRHPSAFVQSPVLKRTKKSSQLPTGGALYFDRGVIEVVTPVIELAPGSTARMVRNLWEQIGFLREELTRWEERTGHTVRLKAFSSHYNVSFELARKKRGRNRTIQKLALLLAHVLPVPVMVLGANRCSTGVGVRPRRERLEVTVDFTPDPALTLATAAFIVGIVREIMSWDSYLLSQLKDLPIAIPAGVKPGKHTSRKGWLTKDFHYPRNPFETDIDTAVWKTTRGEILSLREMALRTAKYFRRAIRKHADPFSVRLLFAVLRGQATSLLELPDRPAAYEDVGRLCRWGTNLPELELQARRSSDSRFGVVPPWAAEQIDRRSHRRPPKQERRKGPRRRVEPSTAQQLTRSTYEVVFQKLGSGQRLRIDGEILIPIGMNGWSQAVFRRESDGGEQRLSIDQLLRHMNRWIS